MQNYLESVRKPLTPNDVGTTGTHQAGVVIPRDPRMLAFFPSLDVDQPNPREVLTFVETNDREWNLNFIYYNGKLLGFSTRNEYRLTGLTPFFREHSAVPGDLLELSRREDQRWGIRLIRKGSAAADMTGCASQPHEQAMPTTGVLETVRLAGTWSAVSRRKNVS